MPWWELVDVLEEGAAWPIWKQGQVEEQMLLTQLRADIRQELQQLR